MKQATEKWGAVGVALILMAGCDRAPNLPRATHHVEIKAMRFEPTVIHVAVGDTVRWSNMDLVPHTVTSQAGGFDSGNLPSDSSWALVVEQGRVLNYACRYHPGMKGSLVAGP